MQRMDRVITIALMEHMEAPTILETVAMATVEVMEGDTTTHHHTTMAPTQTEDILLHIEAMGMVALTHMEEATTILLHIATMAAHMEGVITTLHPTETIAMANTTTILNTTKKWIMEVHMEVHMATATNTILLTATIMEVHTATTMEAIIKITAIMAINQDTANMADTLAATSTPTMAAITLLVLMVTATTTQVTATMAAINQVEATMAATTQVEATMAAINQVTATTAAILLMP